MSELLVRRLTPAELPLLATLFAYRDLDAMVTECTQALESGAQDIFALYEEGVLAGELHAQYVSDDPREAVRGRRAYLFAYRVQESRRGRGLGTLLLARVLDRLSAEGYTEFTIGVEDDNARARRLYERFGFTEVVARKSERFQGRSYEYDLLLKRDAIRP